MPGSKYFLRTTANSNRNDTIDVKFSSAVYNTGNYFFEEALSHHIDDVSIVRNLSDLPDSFDTLVLSMSNFISPFSEVGYLCDEIEKRHISNIVMVGAGAQAYDYSEKITLSPGTMRFVHLLSERSRTIGVRGYFTAEILASLGIHNIEVIGCPTAFWHNKRPLKSPRSLESLAVHCTPSGHYRDKVGALFAHGLKHDARYIVQSERWIMPLIDPTVAEMRENLDTDQTIAYYSANHADAYAIENWLKKSLIYFDMSEWIKAMESFDFVYGSRFHGNMAAIQAGTPALNMPFDTRTRELCEYLNLPHIPLVEFDAEMSLEHLLEAADFSVFEKTIGSRTLAYRTFLENNGLKVVGLESPGEAQKSRVKNNSLSLLQADREAGLISNNEYEIEARLRSREDRSFEERKLAEAGRILKSAGNL